jgi:CMP-N-acetylneuraminic acid synthetase
MKLAVIPARGGSKRLVRKNVRPLLGRSLIRRTVEKALSSGDFDRVIVSTEDEEIAEEARSCGAEVPFIRPAELASDETASVDVLCHAVGQLVLPDDFCHTIVCLLQTTSPLISVESLKQSLRVFENGNFNSLSTMCEAFQHHEWLFIKENDSEKVHPMFPEKFNLPTRQLQKSYIENGAVYIVKADWLMKHGSLYDLSNHGTFLMSRKESIDIDTQEDWDLAEYYLGKEEAHG